MSDIFDEDRMMQALGRYVPAGETVRAGIHGIGIDSEVKEIFGKCVLVDGRLYPDENGGVLEVFQMRRVYRHYGTLSDGCGM